MARGSSYWSNVCGCETCAAFNPSWRFPWRGRVGVCGVCGRDRAALSDFIPDVVRDFLRTSDICTFCRNGINHSVLREQKLCWGSTPDDLLRWALALWLVNGYFAWHFWEHGFCERECCERGLHAPRQPKRRRAA